MIHPFPNFDHSFYIMLLLLHWKNTRYILLIPCLLRHCSNLPLWGKTVMRQIKILTLSTESEVLNLSERNEIIIGVQWEAFTMKWEKKMQSKGLENRSPSLDKIKDLQCKKIFWELSPLLYRKRWHHKEREYTWNPAAHCPSCRTDGRDIAFHFHLLRLIRGLRLAPLLRHY